VVRYAIVRHLVKGKRVLDVACGVGYGARLLSEWGAREVVGVDIAPGAIATARRIFNRSGQTFLTGDAEELAKVLDGVNPFDVIVSFETIEHLARPELFLRALSTIRAPGGVLAVSCPNDAGYGRRLGDNPYHLSIHSFDSFRELTERHLGTATQWLLGAPIVGEANYYVGDKSVETGHDDAKSLLEANPIEDALMLPCQAGLEVCAATCSHFVGLWGAKVRLNAVFSPQSVPAYQEPWRAIKWLKGQVAQLEKTVAEHYEPELARLRAALAELSAENVEREELQREQSRLRELAEQAYRLAQEQYAREIAHLNSGMVKERRIRTDLTCEIQELRARLLTYTEKIAALGSQVDPLRARMQELERIRLEWFEPQLKTRLARIEELETRLGALAQFEASRGYRVWQSYQKLYHVPGVGSLLRFGRRVVSAILRRAF
jgi:2-polyprenyl-3-methyl-5-hydroxy-6-metoxy-1,4-benzoquinol methylase